MWRGALAQVGLGMTPLEAGQVGSPWPLGIGVASGVSVQLAPRIGCRLLGLGALLMVAGMGALILALRLAGAEVAGWHLLPGLALGGLGMGLLAPTLTDFVLAGVPERDAGAASGVVNTTFQVGGAAGVAAVRHALLRAVGRPGRPGPGGAAGSRRAGPAARVRSHRGAGAVVPDRCVRARLPAGPAAACEAPGP